MADSEPQAAPPLWGVGWRANLVSFFPRALPVLPAPLAKMVALDSLAQSDLLASVALRVARVLL